MNQKIIVTPEYERVSSRSNVITKNEAERCCVNPSLYEIIYDHIPRKWLVCIYCIELECFKTDIKEKVRIEHDY